LTGRRAGGVSVSIVCVFNDPAVRQACLDRSIERWPETVEYLPVDNVDGSFPTAGAALNHGAARANGDYVAFVHQDVYLHSLPALQRAADALANDPGIGVVGAFGVRPDGGLAGRIRDRVILLGEPADRPTDVDSLDELLFMTSKRLLELEPLTEDPMLAWHAYAVDYGLRARARGLRVCAVDVPLTHNSLTVNLKRLDAAYATIAAAHPEALPVQTPGGVVTRSGAGRASAGVLANHRWRYRWARESAAVHLGRRAAGGGACVLADIRRDVDDVLARSPDSNLLVINVERGHRFVEASTEPLEITRRGRRIDVAARPLSGVIETIRSRPPANSLLLTNLRLGDLRSLASGFGREARVLGFRREIGFWMLLGPAAATVPPQWRSPRARPPGMRKFAEQPGVI